MFCTDIPAPFFLLFSDAVPSNLLYYSHVPTAIAAVLFSIFVLRKSGKLLSARLLFAISAVFFLWSVASLIVWVNIDSRIVSFAWSLFGILYALLFLVSLYFYLVIVNDDRDVPFSIKLVMFALIVPALLFSSSTANINSFNLTTCEAVDGSWYENYYYLVGIVSFVWILISSFRNLRFVFGKPEWLQKLLLTIGIEMFLIFFFMTSYIAAMTDSFDLEQYGLFGMTIFVAFLGFLVTKFKMFNIRLIGAQSLIFTILLLIVARLFYPQDRGSLVLNVINIILTVISGFFLIRSVRKESQRKEELQRISDSLAKANERLRELDNTKTEFISIASHQLRTPLTAIKGYLSLLLEGSYGAISAEVLDVLEKVNLVNKNLIQLVEDLLNVSRIDAGRIKYSFEPTQLETLVAERVDMFMPIARDRGIELEIRLPKKTLPMMMIDPGKMCEAISNLVDNSIKYTEKGSVIVSIEPVRDEAVRILVEDTGIGFREEDGAKLFGKFVRTQETTKVYVSGTGLGLFVGKSFVEAHGGRMWAESDGLGKGSRFYIELPVVNPKAPMEKENDEKEEK